MLEISCAYSVKYRANGAGRIYITFANLFACSGLAGIGRYTSEYQDGAITITPTPLGTNKLMTTSRGPLLELKNLATSKAIQFASRVLVIAKKNIIKIIPHPGVARQNRREASLINKLQNGKTLCSGSLFSGLGLLNLHLKTGLAAAGIKSAIRFANDICHAASHVNCETNPIWDTAHKRAQFINDDIRALTHLSIPEVDILDISLPCNGFSTLISADKRDLEHPIVGTLFVSTIEAIRRLNPAVFVIECTPALNKSKTLELMQRELTDYTWLKQTVNGLDHGEIERRERAFIMGISSGLADGKRLASFGGVPPTARPRPTLSEFLEPQQVRDQDWKYFQHVVAKSKDTRLNFKHKTYKGEATEIATLVATYASPKIGSPFIANQENTHKIRAIHPIEHANIRRIPVRMKDAISSIVAGTSTHTNKLGSNSLAHRLLGLSVSRYPWEAVGKWIGLLLNDIAFERGFTRSKIC